MSEFYTKEDRERVKRLNQILRMKHRDKPYDVNAINDVKEWFTMTVAEYIDYSNYYLEINSVEERFDESLEHYDPVSWMGLTMAEVKCDALARKVDRVLREADDCLYKLSSRAEKKCRKLLEIILEQREEFQRAVLGNAYAYSAEMLDEVFDNCYDIETYAVEDSLEAFLKILEQHLKIKK